MSTPHTSEAVVLRTVNYSDSSLIVRLFTEQYGKVAVMAKGARRFKQGTVGVLQPPNHIDVWYQHKERREIQTLVKSEFVERYANLADDLQTSAAALVAVEMLDRAVHEADPHPIIFRLITATLQRLNQGGGDDVVVLHFYQLHLARQLGFGPQIALCEQCGLSLTSATLDSPTGRLLCHRCQADGATPIGGSALKHLRDLAATHITNLDTLRPNDRTKKQVGDFLLKHLFFHVDGMSNLKSIKFWHQVTA